MAELATITTDPVYDRVAAFFEENPPFGHVDLPEQRRNPASLETIEAVYTSIRAALPMISTEQRTGTQNTASPRQASVTLRRRPDTRFNELQDAREIAVRSIDLTGHGPVPQAQWLARSKTFHIGRNPEGRLAVVTNTLEQDIFPSDSLLSVGRHEEGEEPYFRARPRDPGALEEELVGLQALFGLFDGSRT